MADDFGLAELRCAWGFVADGHLVLDADLVQEERSGRGAVTEVVCRGHRISKPRDSFGDEAWAWLLGEDPEWDDGLGRLPDDAGAAQRWGGFVQSLLQTSPQVVAALGELLDRPGLQRRVAFDAVEPRASRIPVELLLWDVGERVVAVDELASVVRVARPLRRFVNGGWLPPLGGRDADVVRAALHAPGPAHDEAIKALTPDSLAWADPHDPKVAGAVAAADVVVLTAHGAGPDGIMLGSDDPVGPDVLAPLLAGGPAGVVLAVCKAAASSAPAAEHRPSIAEAVAARGVGVTVAFHGSEVLLPKARDVALAIIEGLSPAANDLAAWEQVIAEAGRGLTRGGIVVHVHPALLAGRRPAVRRFAGCVRGTATVVPYYVPGQVAWMVGPGGRAARVPVPVDAGVELRVTVGSGCEHDTGSTSLDAVADLAVLGAEFGLPPGTGIAVAYAAGTPPAGWATRSAEVSAVVRALAGIVNVGAPAGARALVDARVGEDWGTHDERPRLVDVQTGRSVRLLAGWPPLKVVPVPLGGDVSGLSAGLRDAPPVLPGEADSLGTLVEADAFLALAREQRYAFRERREQLPEVLWDALRHRDVIVVPAAAKIAAGPWDGSGVPRIAG